jgi:hypothetical protein
LAHTAGGRILAILELERPNAAKIAARRRRSEHSQAEAKEIVDGR